MGNREPFNLAIIKLTEERLRALRPVRSLDIFDGMSSNFHDDGLFSVTTFGRVGSDERDRKFGFIDIKAHVFHPIIHKRLIQLVAFYEKIMTGKAFAVFDKVEQNFIPCTPDVEGAGTGYGFFCQYWEQIKLKRNKSLSRNFRVDLVEKYRDRGMTERVLVMPAGLRDIEVDEHGHTKEHEFNEPYRKMVAVSNTLHGSVSAHSGNAVDNNSFLDGPRRSIQAAFNDLYDRIDNTIYGKKGFAQAKWGSRAIFNGTRNVITSMDTSTYFFGGPQTMRIYDTQIGLFQTIKGCLPVAVHCLSAGYLSRVFSPGDVNALLVNKKTLRPEYVQVSSETIDRWASVEGLEKVIDGFEEEHVRQTPIDIEGYWLGLIYVDDKYFKIFNDIDELPPHLSPENVHPLTLTQLIYLSGYRRWYELPIYVTRFPVTGVGSMYPNMVYTRTTIKASPKTELDWDWEPMGDDYIAREFPDLDPHATFMDSQSPHPAYLGGLGADFDGDTASGDIVYSKEAVEEAREYMNSRGFLVSPSGGLYTPADTDIIALVLRNLLSDVE